MEKLPGGRYDRITPMQSWAYEVANNAYYVPDKTSMMDTAIGIYKSDMHGKIVDLFQRADKGNALLNAATKPVVLIGAK